MEWNKENLKGLLLVICGGVAFYCALQNLPAVSAACGWVLGILAPFLLGAAIAFVLNVPMRAIERHLFPNAKRGAALRRPLALVLTLMAVIGVLVIPLLILPTRSAGRTRWKLLSESQAKHEELLQQGGVYQKLFETQFGRMLNQDEE